MTLDLSGLFSSLVLPLTPPSGVNFSAVAVPGYEMHRIAKDAGGSPCLLLRHPRHGNNPPPPTRLQNLTVSYDVPCSITDPNGILEMGQFSIIRCSSADPGLFPHFLRILSPIVVSLGPSPSMAAIRRSISGLVELFQALTAPATKSVQGVWAELLLIRYATDPQSVVMAWHRLPHECVDFVSGAQRIEMKSSSARQRVHHFSLEQLSPPASARLLVASVFVERTGGGVSLGQLAQETRARLEHSPALLTHFDAKFYSSLGEAWRESLDDRFDLDLARESLQFFDSSNIPKIAAPLPIGVSEVRFRSDLSQATAFQEDEMASFGGLFAAAMPEA
jgi:hypothetical protein